MKTKRNKFTRRYFIRKFESLSDSEVGRGLNGHCALWHCGVRTDAYGNYKVTREAVSLSKIIAGKNYRPSVWDSLVYIVNDAFAGRTPLKNILAALKKKVKQ